jgi:hypothetical protein
MLLALGGGFGFTHGASDPGLGKLPVMPRKTWVLEKPSLKIYRPAGLELSEASDKGHKWSGRPDREG